MKKVYLIAHHSLKSPLIDTLQTQGLLQITNLKEEVLQSEFRETIRDFEPDLEEFELLLSQIHFVLEVITGFEEKRKGFVSSLIKERTKVDREKFQKIEGHLNFKDVYQECENLYLKLAELSNKLSHFKVLREDLLPWTSSPFELSDLGETKYTVVTLGKLSAANLARMLSEAEEIPEAEIEIISKDHKNAYFLLIYHKAVSEAVSLLLRRYDFSTVSFPDLAHSPQEEILILENTSQELEKERNEISERIRQFVFLKPDLLVLRDFVANKKRRLEIEANFAHTKATFMVEGWIKEADLAKFQERVEEISKEVAISYFDPLPEEHPPVILENRNWLKPFEVVTQLYGLPNYYELDPTPYLAPFFIVFFGLCIGDVGYGIVLALVSWWLRKKLPVGQGTKNFFGLLIYGGFSSMIAGAITGSWFAIPVKSLPQLLKNLMLFDPLVQPTIFLVLAIILGFSQLWFGVALEMYENIRSKRILDAFLDQGSMLIFLPGVALLIARLFVQTKPPAWHPFDIWLALIGASLIVLFHNRANRNIFARIFGGLYSLYGMTSFLGDTISYARLMALGLATVLIGLAINMLGQLALAVPYIGILLMIVILIGGHLFNLMINLLGAFIHPARLQYVEFFTKFYEDGGKKFKPFAIETENLIIE